jgi:hypothetical protein
VSRTVITLDDTTDGGIASSVCYEDGFSLNSPAHVAGLMLAKHMSTLAEPLGDEQVFGGAPSAREAIQGARPEDAIPSGIQIEVTNDKDEESRVA